MPGEGILAGVEDDPRRQASESEQGEAGSGKSELRPARGRTFLPEVTGVEFSSSRRGYDRVEVDRYVERVSRIVVELEAMRSPDAVIERALADVGEETSAILRRARKAGEEIITDAEGQARERTAQADAQARERTAQADAQARDAREDADRYSAGLKAEGEQALNDAHARAERIEAQAGADARRVREDADRYRTQVLAHIEQLSQERHRLIEDLRKLADQFHRTADRALEQIPEEPSRELAYQAVEGNGDAASTDALPG